VYVSPPIEICLPGGTRFWSQFAWYRFCIAFQVALNAYGYILRIQLHILMGWMGLIEQCSLHLERLPFYKIIWNIVYFFQIKYIPYSSVRNVYIWVHSTNLEKEEGLALNCSLLLDTWLDFCRAKACRNSVTCLVVLPMYLIVLNPRVSSQIYAEQ
jgi:hypothetical protein